MTYLMNVCKKVNNIKLLTTNYWKKNSPTDYDNYLKAAILIE